MTEEENSLERELAAMNPRQLPPTVMAELSKIIDEAQSENRSRSFGDRMLIGTMATGLAAAIVIVAMLSIQLMENPSSPADQAAIAVTSGKIRSRDSIVVLARFGDGAAVDGRENAPGKPPG